MNVRVAILVAAVGAALAYTPASAAVPVQAGAPWPSMRGDSRNTGQSQLPASYHGDMPWRFPTAKGIFSVPVVGADGTVYVGSADTYFYALNPNGTLRWRLKTGNIIDSAAVIGAYDPSLGTSPLTFGSADENLYHVSTNVSAPARCRSLRSHRSHLTLRSECVQRRRASAQPTVLWRFRPTQPPQPGQLVNWWEGNASIGPGGTIYAGNTGGYEYAVNPNGTQKWVFGAGNSIWTEPAFADDGTAYVGSLDAFVYAVDRDGRQLWRTPMLGFVISSPALARDGTLYVGSFDSHLYALDSRTGAIKWSFASGDHIYSSPALAEDTHGNTTAIYFGSADGSVYALSPSGKLLWRYDTGDVVRSSPALAGGVVYVGNAAGTLYALDATTGRRRWSYDTTLADPTLRDRNDFNSSPAPGRTGVYIGSEDGSVEYVPYDYCLHRRDPRCNTSPGEAFGPDLTRVFPVTAGGSTEQAGYQRPLSAATTIVGRLVVRRGGQTQNAALQAIPNAKSLVTTSPHFDFDAELSGGGHYIFITPTGFLEPNRDYSVRIAGSYAAQGLRVANVTVGGTTVGAADDTIRFHTASAGGHGLPLRKRRDRVSAFNLRRLAVPLPAFLPSVNQIGFDSYDLIVGTIATTPSDRGGQGSLLLWAIGARKNSRGVSVADPSGNFAFPLGGLYRDNFLQLRDNNLALTFSFGKVPLARFDVRAQLGQDLMAMPGASLYAEAVCPNVPHYGPFLFIAGLCNTDAKIVASGTFITDAYNHAGDANKRPRGVAVTRLTLTRPTATANGAADADVSVARRATYLARDHIASILLTDASTGQPVSIDYRARTTDVAGARGDLDHIHVAIPAGTSLPQHVRAYVITDVFPLLARDL